MDDKKKESSVEIELDSVNNGVTVNSSSTSISDPKQGYDNHAFDLGKYLDASAGSGGRRESRISNFDQLGTILSSLDEEENESEEEEQLHLITTAKIPKKDFILEVRANLDVKHYVDKMTISLNMDASDICKLVHDLLTQMKMETKIDIDLEEIMGSIFSDHKYKLLTNRIQGAINEKNGYTVFDQSWLCILGSGVSVKKRMIGLARTVRPLNLGNYAQDARFILVVLTPAIEKQTKTSYEIGRTFSSILLDREFRYNLLETKEVSGVRNLFRSKARELAESKDESKKIRVIHGLDTSLWENIARRVRWYHTDFIDGIIGHRTLHKTLATSLFLYFACLLPSIAFGVLNAKNTNGLIGAERALIGQALGGLVFALIGGQPLVIIATTALVSLYIKVVYEISGQLGVDFFVMYASVGFWNTLFVLTYAIFGWSKLIKFATRSVEEIFAQFITFCFFYDAINDVVTSFRNNYFSEACRNETIMLNQNSTLISVDDLTKCVKEESLLHLILMLGTVWLSLQIYKFNKSPFLSRGMREFISDYALPIGVLGFAAIASFVFTDIKVGQFEFSNTFKFERASVDFSSWKVIGLSIVLGFALSLLFFMDQNITGQIVNAPTNHLKKGSAPHLDLLVIGIINCILSFYGLPWMHGILPHSPLHVRSLADVEERNNQGCIETVIIRVRETRLTALICNILIGLSLFMIPYPLNLIPVPVLDGLFLYCAFASLRGSSLFERICLLFQEQSSYPPNHYVRHVRQRVIHAFTICEITQLIILCIVGFAPWAYLRMAFPVFIALLMPIRHLVLPCFVDKKTLKLLDTYG